MFRGRRIVLIPLAIAGIIFGVMLGTRKRHIPPRLLPPRALAGLPTSVPATLPTAVAPAPTDFMGLVLAHNPDFPTTQPLAMPAELHEGARLILPEPIYLDSMQELWITRDDAPGIRDVLKTANDDQVHVVRQRVLFVHRFLDDAGNWQPQPIYREADGSLVLITADSRQVLGNKYHYRWDRAFDWNSNTNEGFVVPTDTGVSVFRPRSLPVEMHFEFQLGTSGAATAPATAAAFEVHPQMLLDNRGLIAWIPWENDAPGSRGAARFVDGQWQPLGPDQGWPQKVLHLIPLIGGGVLQLVVNDDGTVTEQRAQLDATPVDPKVVDPLIDQLSDPDPKVRDAASDELTRYGPGLWPILEKTIDDQPPEGQLRIRRLLDAKQNPTLGQMQLQPGKVRVLSHLEDGGAVLLAEGGISVPNRDPAQPPTVTVPAYICIRPDRPIDLAPPALVADLPPDARFDVAPDEWIETDDAHGPRRFVGNHLENLLHKSERRFSQFIGIDRRGRWLFREPGADTPTLLLDPNLPDATPRIAAWIDPLACDQAGWDDAAWPAFSKQDVAWALHAEEWSPLPRPGPDRKFYTSVDTMPPASPAVAATGPSTQSTTTASSQAMPIFTDADGTLYYNGLDALDVRRWDGTRVHWPLPAEAVGSGEVHLLRAGDRLFLFNAPGRLLRILPTPRSAAPFKLEATFTRSIPNTDHYTRIWLDPAGRIDLVYDTHHLTLLFPDGRIPRPISEKMPADQLKPDDD